MNITTPRKIIATAVALSGVVAVPSVIAQEGQHSLKVEEVVVTARRREESLQDVPIAVTAVSAEQLDIQGYMDLSELAQTVPSMTLEPSRATNTTLTAFIRGVGQQDPLAGFEQGVALYIDDVYLARPQGALLDIYDVERIEVLRGPQGTLYGRNAVGGAIKYVTRRLSEQPEVRARVAVGTYNQRDLVLTGSTPLGDKVKLGATIASLNRDGFGDNVYTGAEQYDKDVLGFRISGEYTPNDDILLRVAYDKTRDDSSAVAGYRPYPGLVSGEPVLGDVHDTRAGASINAATAGIDGNNEVESEGASVALDWHLNDQLTLRSVTAWREDYTESVIDFDSLPVNDFDAPVIYDNEQFSQELQLLYIADNLNAVMGVYYLDASAANDFDVVLGQISGGVTAYTGGKVDTKALSLFADVTWNINARTALSVGGRYTRDKRSADIYRSTYLGIGSPFFGNASAFFLRATSDYDAERTYTDFSPRLNISYELNDDTTLYGGYSQGFKAGSFDPRGANFSTPVVEEGFDPETLDSFELGIKSHWWDGRAITNIAVFYSDYQDMQVPGSVGVDSDGDGTNDSFVGTVTNAGKAEISGIELEGVFVLTEGFTANVALSLLDANIKEWMLDGVNVASSRVVQNTPEEMFSLGLNYHLGLAGGDLNLSTTWAYKGDTAQFETPNPVLDQKAYDTINASAVWVSGDERWRVGLHGKNLTDEEIKTSGYCFGSSGGCPTALGLEDNVTVFYAPPRTVTATLEYRL
ncbi:MAG: TonB-dependent receptor [Gammaproteobacteria bacterium]|nr:MAG: TonB-dependent receptor [Gammaproteobacteria bacterium]